MSLAIFQEGCLALSLLVEYGLIANGTIYHLFPIVGILNL